MVGGLLQIVAYGFQDIYLTNDPQITFFKVVYRRHTNFSIQAFEKTFNDNPDFGKTNKVKLYRLGDLATKMYLRVVINAVTTVPGIPFAWVQRLGHAMIRRVEIEIGGVLIDRQYGTWLDVWYELARYGKHDYGYDKMIGEITDLTTFDDQPKPEYTLYIPLQFWFNRNYGLALPLISIQYHDIYISVEFEPNTQLIVRCPQFTAFDQVKILEVGLVTDYIYLDMDERRRFADKSHEYLIEQVQSENDLPAIITYPYRLVLNFINPTKELIWAMKNGNYTTGKEYLCYSNIQDWTITLINCSKQILTESMVLLSPGTPPPTPGTWEEFPPGVVDAFSNNGNLKITNMSLLTLWINITSLTIGNYSITSQIVANIIISEFNAFLITIINPISDRDASIPYIEMTDTRINPGSSVCVYQFNNYALYITGKGNPLSSAMLEYNGQNRVDRRDGKFFGVLQPYLHHSNTPHDGINLYSFAIEPEKHQPTGTSNLSKIENSILTMWFEDTGNINKTLPPITVLGLDSRLYIYAYSYNILRIISGLVGLSY